jgi:hypothetical protein
VAIHYRTEFCAPLSARLRRTRIKTETLLWELSKNNARSMRAVVQYLAMGEDASASWWFVFVCSLFNFVFQWLRLCSVEWRCNSEWLIGKDLEGSGCILVLRFYPCICLEGLRKNTENLSQVASPQAEIWTRTPEYEAGVFTTLPRRSVGGLWKQRIAKPRLQHRWHNTARFEVCRCWDAAPCNLPLPYRSDQGGDNLWNVGKFLPAYMA